MVDLPTHSSFRQHMLQEDTVAGASSYTNTQQFSMQIHDISPAMFDSG